MQWFERLKALVFGPTPREILLPGQVTYESLNLATLPKDDHDRLEAQFKLLCAERDEWKRKALEREGRYEAILTILDRYADPQNWTPDAMGALRRQWVRNEHGYQDAARWFRNLDQQL